MNALFSVHVLATVFCFGPVNAAPADEPLALNDGERILFIGNGYVENDQWHAHFETRLQRRFADRTLTFRYMGWSGDTIRGSARTAGFQVPQGLARLEKETQAQKPTLIFLVYGMNESFGGPQALADFLRDYDSLVKALAPLKARLVIVSPTYHEDLGPPFPDPSEHNRHLEQFTLALKTFAMERKIPFVDLYHPLESTKKAAATVRLSTNGILLTETAYNVAAEATEKQLGYAPIRWEVTLDQSGKIADSVGVRLSSIEVQAGMVRFQAHDTKLPIAGDEHRLRITGLPPGEYTLKIDGNDIVRASNTTWQGGLHIGHGPKLDDTKKLRQAIVLRNQLFYRRWRPYNDHSRHWGFIGGDFKLYDLDIARQEQRIAELRTPRPHIYEIIRTGP